MTIINITFLRREKCGPLIFKNSLKLINNQKMQTKFTMRNPFHTCSQVNSIISNNF